MGLGLESKRVSYSSGFAVHMLPAAEAPTARQPWTCRNSTLPLAGYPHPPSDLTRSKQAPQHLGDHPLLPCVLLLATPSRGLPAEVGASLPPLPGVGADPLPSRSPPGPAPLTCPRRRGGGGAAGAGHPRAPAPWPGGGAVEAMEAGGRRDGAHKPAAGGRDRPARDPRAGRGRDGAGTAGRGSRVASVGCPRPCPHLRGVPRGLVWVPVRGS